MSLKLSSLLYSALVLAVTLSLATVPSVARAEEQRSVSVNGTCLHSVQPDRASITVTVDHLEPTLQAAAKKTADAYERVKKAVQALQLKNAELTTSEYSLQEVREWEKDRQVFKGFRARMGLQISTSEISRLGEVIALASKEQVRDVSSLSTFLSQEKMKSEHESCLDEAVKNAQAKAETMAKAARAKVSQVLQMRERVPGTEPEPRPMLAGAPMMAKAMDQAMPAPTIEAGPQRISVEVSVTFALQ